MPKLLFQVFLVLLMSQYPSLGFSETAILLPSGASEYETRFGNTIDAHNDDIIIGSFRGDAVYIFHRQDGSWFQQARLTSGEDKTNDTFGYGVSIEGDYALVGATSNTSQFDRTGTVYAFKREGSSWRQIDTLKASDGEQFDQFGCSLDQSGSYAIVGAWGDDDRALSSGSAYIFKLVNDQWIQTAKLVPVDGGLDDHFGYSVSISGDSAIVGAYNNNDGDSEPFYGGSVYFYERVGEEWVLSHKASGEDLNKYYWVFGLSVAIDSDRAVIGDSGSITFFDKREGSWEHIQTSYDCTGQAAYDHINCYSEVSLSGEYAGARGVLSTVEGGWKGLVSIFKRKGSEWAVYGHAIEPPGGSSYFGKAFTLSSDYIAIADYQANYLGPESGVVFVYTLSDLVDPPEPPGPPPPSPQSGHSGPWMFLLLKNR